MAILAPVNGIGFPFTEKDERRVRLLNNGINFRNLAGLQDGTRSWDSMYMDIRRGILMSLLSLVKIWRFEDLSSRNLRLSQMTMGYISSIFLEYPSISDS